MTRQRPLHATRMLAALTALSCLLLPASFAWAGSAKEVQAEAADAAKQAEPIRASASPDANAPSASAPADPDPAHADHAPRIDVVFVLDTTGSMSGLIDGAKRKIWHIANGIVSEKPTPRVRFGLVAYRDRGDDYITKRFDLTENIDEVYENLQGFAADGGGDGPESVNQALHEAVTEMSWDESRSVTKIIFLVGDAPPHMDYENDVEYPEVCKVAVKNDLIINTVQCGSMNGTREVWQKIARLAEGNYAAIGQSGDMRVVSTPHDEKLAELNREIGQTMVPYGDRASREKQAFRQRRSEAAEAEVAADRASYMSAKAAPAAGEPLTGRDLTDALEGQTVSLEDVEVDKLPEKLQKMSEEQRKQYLEKQVARRAELKNKIRETQAARRQYIEKQQEAEGEKDGFDAKVLEWVREQSKRGEAPAEE